MSYLKNYGSKSSFRGNVKYADTERESITSNLHQMMLDGMKHLTHCIVENAVGASNGQQTLYQWTEFRIQGQGWMQMSCLKGSQTKIQPTKRGRNMDIEDNKSRHYVHLKYGKHSDKAEHINQFAKQKYAECLAKAIHLKRKKSHDYNSGGINKFDYNLHGNITCLDDIWKKVLRLRSLIDSGAAPTNESVEDTLIDIINYSADFYAYLQYQKMKQEKK